MSWVRSLIPVFLSRFFEQESSRTAVDVRHSFLWLMAVLATPGFFLPLYHTSSRWGFIAVRDGVAEARLAALFDKALYLQLTLVAMGVLATMVWHTLVVNRRDALVLSALPVPMRAIIIAKLGALGVYVAVVSAGMHGVAGLMYGTFLGSLEGAGQTVLDVGAQWLAATLLGFWVFAAVAAVQSACLLVVGPRYFSRWSIALQLLAVGAVMVMLMATPLTAQSARATVTGADWTQDSLLIHLPSYWFLGVQEVLSGSQAAQAPALAWRAVIALSGSLLLLGLTYPAACRRVLRAAIQDAPPRAAALPQRVAAWLTARLAPEPAVRAAVQFFLATIGRVHGHRLTLSIATGIGLVGAMAATLVGWSEIDSRPRAPTSLALAAAPHYLVFAVSVGLRLVASLPAELPARWPFETTPASLLAGRVAARRVMLAYGVVLPVCLFAPVWVAAWGMPTALAHLTGSIAAGAALVEVLIWGFASVPGTREAPPGDSRLASRGMSGLLAFLFFVTSLPSLQLVLDGSLAGPYILALVWTGATWVIRQGGDDAARVRALTDHDDGMTLLDLTLPTQAPNRPIVGARPGESPVFRPGDALNEDTHARRT
jgi:hypothetical protein